MYLYRYYNMVVLENKILYFLYLTTLIGFTTIKVIRFFRML